MARRLRSLTPGAGVVVWALALATITLAVLLVGVFRAYQAATWDLLHERDLQVAYLAAARLREEVTRQASVLTVLAREEVIAEGTARQRADALEESEPELAVFDAGVVLLDNFGRVSAAFPPRPALVGVDWSDRDYFRAQISSPGVALSDLNHDGADGGLAVALSVPLTDAEGEFSGVLAGLFGIGHSGVSTLYASIVRLRMDQRGHTYVVDGQDRIIYDSGYVDAGVLLSERGPLGLGDLRRAGTLRTRDQAGNDILAAHAPVPGTRWALVLEDDWDALTEPVDRYRRLMLGLVVLGVSIPVAGLAWSVRRRREDVDPGAWPDGPVDIAAAVRRVLAPRHVYMLPGWSTAIHVQPAGAGTRNYFDYHVLPDGRLVQVLCHLPADPVAAARAMTTVRTCLRDAARRGQAPEAALAEVNALLHLDTGPDAPVACVWLTLDPLTGRARVANAGCPPPRHVMAEHTVDLLENDTPLGGAADGAWPAVDLVLAPGDCLVLHTIALDALAPQNAEGDDLELVCGAIRKRDDSAQYRLDDLLGALRAWPGHPDAERRGYIVMVLARAAETAEAPA